MKASEKLSEILKYLKISANKFSVEIGLEKNTGIYHLKNDRNDISPEMANTIIVRYPEFNYSWLITGKGEMLNEMSEEDKKIAEDYIEKFGNTKQKRLSLKPKAQLYYPDVVVTNSNIQLYDQLASDKVEVREMYDPNLEGADIVLPNFSDSNEPYIKSGDLVGYRKLEVNSYDSLNLDLLYMIITVNNQRMNKKLQVYKNDNSKMWAISINCDKHKPFPILKEDIVELWEVVGVSRRFV